MTEPVLQDGIYYQWQHDKADRQFRLLLLNLQVGTTSAQARDAITRVWSLLADLKRGLIPELRSPLGDQPVPSGNLSTLLGYGHRLFARAHMRPTTGAFAELRSIVNADAPGPFPSLPWAVDPTLDRARGEGDLAIQLIADTELAVNRACVEVHSLIQEQHLPLDLVACFDGYGRDDERSWLGFHDCISNIDPADRLNAMVTTEDMPSWLRGGTYMAFLRLAIDVQGWRKLRREHQELLVGRAKMTGCPIVRVERDVMGELIPVAADVPRGHPKYDDPDPSSDPIISASHVHRANVNRTPPQALDSNRIFRQAFEFWEVQDDHFRVGLNFVSFQHRLSCLTNILGAQVWLGEVNFGGPVTPIGGLHAFPLLSVLAGGFYAVPPQDEPFPGASLFV